MRINSNLNSIIVMSVISILLASFKRYLLKHLKYIHNIHRKKLTYAKMLLKISKLYRYGILEYLESKMYVENDLDPSLHRSEENKTAKIPFSAISQRNFYPWQYFIIPPSLQDFAINPRKQRRGFTRVIRRI